MYANVSNADLTSLRAQLAALTATAAPLVDRNALPTNDWAFPMELLVHLQHGLNVEAESRGLTEKSPEWLFEWTEEEFFQNERGGELFNLTAGPGVDKDTGEPLVGMAIETVDEAVQYAMSLADAGRVVVILQAAIANAQANARKAQQTG